MPETLTYPIRSDKLTMSVRIEQTLWSEKTTFQQIDFYETTAFGKMLFLDGHVQLAERDERAYHEALVQVPLLNLDKPTRALIIGGGDGAVARELCRHTTIEQIDMVEIDAGVVEASRKVWPDLSAGSFEDPRVRLTIGDAFPWVKAAQGPYDLIVADSTDVYEEEGGGLSEMLFTDAFYQDCLRLLSPQGILVTQADNLLFCPYSLEGILEVFGRVFPTVGSYWALVPSFGGYSGFAYASRGKTLATRWADLRPPQVDLTYLGPTTYDLGFGPLPFG